METQTAINTVSTRKRRVKVTDEAREKIEELAKTSLSTREMENMLNLDHSTIAKVLKKYGIERRNVDDYSRNRAEIFAGLQEKILRSIDMHDIQKTPAVQRVTMAGILYDKERLERGQATDIIDHRVITAKLSEVTDRLRSISNDFTNSHESEDAGDTI